MGAGGVSCVWFSRNFGNSCDDTVSARRRDYGGEAAATCQTTCAAELGCQVPFCTVVDGSTISTGYPCMCGGTTCMYNQICTASSSTCQQGPCAANADSSTIEGRTGYTDCIQLKDHCKYIPTTRRRVGWLAAEAAALCQTD